MRGPFRGQEQDVGNALALPQQVLAACEVGMPRLREFPPGLGAFVGQSVSAHGHSGPLVRPRLVGITVEYQAVDADAERPVCLVFHVSGMEFPEFALVEMRTGERFDPDDRPVVDPGRRNRLDTAERSVEHIVHFPGFAHRHVGDAAQCDVVVRTHVVRLDRQPETVPVCVIAQVAGVIFEHEFL